jgi:ribosomal protein S18 acetylase RimI-like enzyme
MVIDFVGSMYASSPFLARYPEEWKISLEDETKFLKTTVEATDRIMLGAFADGKLVGLTDCLPVSANQKIHHRGQCAISVASSFAHKGLGSLIFGLMLEQAKLAGFEQVELEVVASNVWAIRLYEKYGFVRIGIIPHGFKYKDGSYQDLVIMVCNLS